MGRKIFLLRKSFEIFVAGKIFLKKRNPFLGDDLIKADFRLSYKRFFSDFQNELRLRAGTRKTLAGGSAKAFLLKAL